MSNREKSGKGRGREYFAKTVGTLLLLASASVFAKVTYDYVEHKAEPSTIYEEVVDEQTAAINSFESIPDANEIGIGTVVGVVGLAFVARGMNLSDRRHEAAIADASRAAARHMQI